MALQRAKISPPAFPKTDESAPSPTYIVPMSLANRIFRPFETLIRPLDLPTRPMPDEGPFKLVWYFAKMKCACILIAARHFCAEEGGRPVSWKRLRLGQKAASWTR
jgi:hypothetical protein